MPVVQFFDLPIELLSPILSHLPRPSQLATVCLVNKVFYQTATPNLYQRLTVFSWHKNAKTRVVQLFATLAACPHLARHVRHLEIREFPKILSITPDAQAQNVLHDVLQGLKNCANLRSCTWTRDGSLTSDILQALLCASSGTALLPSNTPGPSSSLPSVLSTRPRLVNHGLRELEINGRDQGLYDRTLLLGFVALQRISLIMPTALVVSLLPTWTALNHKSLRTLTLICKSSPVITDEVLVSLAPSLVHLEEFHLAGCPKVTQEGLWAILSPNIEGIVGLRLEGLSPRFDMAEFSQRCTSNNSLHRLRSITLTIRQQHQPLEKWLGNVLALLAPAPLEVFQIYSLGMFIEAPVTDAFWRALVTTHGPHLTRFSVHRMLIGLDTIQDVCERCVRLEQLFIVVEPASLDALGSALSHARNLRVVHINHPLEARTSVRPMSVMTDISSIVSRCSPTLVQIGYNTRVWQVTMKVNISDEGDLSTSRTLSAYESPEIPEPFLVVRT
ncbi:hypothetical protein AMATHDRAFT_144018 [Amanita thiersii Skay4041]|uniref:F-box domain-containing protein n=1 Tax=Amanita thiersii Skay4041 TaxID=703135 RepID=A0A2A9NL90_9AGAR|nr:hypothetical protein AMATHDRAFT_144018 [Amanita thiersii Skay4041]